MDIRTKEKSLLLICNNLWFQVLIVPWQKKENLSLHDIKHLHKFDQYSVNASSSKQALVSSIAFLPSLPQCHYALEGSIPFRHQDRTLKCVQGCRLFLRRPYSLSHWSDKPRFLLLHGHSLMRHLLLSYQALSALILLFQQVFRLVSLI